jgi:signal transduction histidine kinase
MDATVPTVSQSESIATLLLLASEIAGSNVALLARLAGDAWTVCAAQVSPAGVSEDCQLLGRAVRLGFGPMGAPISINLSGSQSSGVMTTSLIACGVSAPVVLRDGRCFGVLCALDPNSLDRADERIGSKFKCLASVIASQIDQLMQRDRQKTAFLDERAAGLLREQFIAILGHDLRNPLQAIFASSDLLVRRIEQPALAHMAARIKTNARRMSSLIDDVLDFARAKLGGGIGVELTEVEDISHGLTTVVQELQDAQTDCIIISNFHVNRSVRCDLGRLQQVASNLLGNALTHGQPQSPIKITARTDEDNLVIEVRNSGEPIPAESLSKIFEPFWRHSISSSRNGLGLGLHICSEIVRAHQGSISVTSTRESGTQFTARLPLTSPVAATFRPEVSKSISAYV